ncbi:MAG: metalloregulator ArsR/SmtB family transcription factor [Actinobacteria bacterium]|nr:winged helix-turn-helix transcriptional regulator [Acidimicrobiia bacterium]MCA1737049.1 metalloregulator ArsR/SmtB family transcription factor [Actinomycetota bacterium]MDQ3501010.1 metalloregulator ArsR/SmtB family transcription factor [Actinomycetota bacterium]
MEVVSCCVPVTEEALSADQARDLADDFKVLSDPVRLRLLSLIASVPEGEVCACDMNDPLERSQATVSHHLSVLVKSGLITREQRGKWAWFRIAADRADFVRSVLGGQPVMSIS